MSDRIKLLLLKYYLGLIDHTEVIAEVDNQINLGVWLDEFEYIYTENKLVEGKWISQFHGGAFRLVKSDFNGFESNFFPVLKNEIIKNQGQSIRIIVTTQDCEYI